jgi:hypothetical protein
LPLIAFPRLIHQCIEEIRSKDQSSRWIVNKSADFSAQLYCFAGDLHPEWVGAPARYD